jgi:hypothetical protein
MGSAHHPGSPSGLGESVGLGEGEGEGLGDGDGLGESDGDGEGEGLGEGFGVGLGLDGLALGDEPVGEDVDGKPVAGGDGSAAISRPKSRRQDHAGRRGQTGTSR